MWLPLTRRSDFGRGLVRRLAEELRRPRAGGIDQRPRPQLALPAVGAFEADLPVVGAAPGVDAARARQDRRAALGGVDRVQDDEPGVVDPAVGVDEALA